MVNFFLVLNLIMLALDNPLNDPDSGLSRALNVINILVCAFFVIEAFVKIIALGFCSTSLQSKEKNRKAYMHNILNIVDFIIAMMHVVDLCLVHNQRWGEANSCERLIRGFQAIRALRLLHPLR